MAASPAQIEANRRNAEKSTGPKTDEGKARSRANALKHGMTGAGIVLPKEDAAEVERLADAFRAELKPAGEVGEVLIRRMAVHAVRMDRAVVQETAALTIHMRETRKAFQRSNAYLAKNSRTLGTDAVNRASFDASPEATLARKYEAASERGYHMALKELRRMRVEAARAARPKPAPAKTPAVAVEPDGKSGSFFPAPATPARPIQPAPEPVPAPALHRAFALTSTALGLESVRDAHCDIPLTIGRPR